MLKPVSLSKTEQAGRCNNSIFSYVTNLPKANHPVVGPSLGFFTTRSQAMMAGIITSIPFLLSSLVFLLSKCWPADTQKCSSPICHKAVVLLVRHTHLLLRY